MATTDRLLGDITLYASYAENQPFESHSIATFARAIDVEGDSLVIQITDKSGALRVSEILKACTLTNLRDSTEEITLGLAAAGNNTYTIIKENGWKEGSDYKLVLDNEDFTMTHYVSDILEKLHIDKRDKIKDFVNQ